MHEAGFIANTRSPRWTRGVLLWLLLAFAAALASPLVQPKSIELLCTGTGSVKLLVGGTGDADSNASMAADCALCVQASLPPSAQPVPTAAPHSTAYALHTVAAPRTSSHAAPPLPARGPPSPQRA